MSRSSPRTPCRPTSTGSRGCSPASSSPRTSGWPTARTGRAWERVPFREVPYAEDQALALDMLRAGFAKAYMPDAAVIHSHEYATVAQFRRSFDEWRGLREVHGWVEPARPVATLLTIQSRVRSDVRSLRGSVPPRTVVREGAR